MDHGPVDEPKTLFILLFAADLLGLSVGSYFGVVSRVCHRLVTAVPNLLRKYTLLNRRILVHVVRPIKPSVDLVIHLSSLS